MVRSSSRLTLHLGHLVSASPRRVRITCWSSGHCNSLLSSLRTSPRQPPSLKGFFSLSTWLPGRRWPKLPRFSCRALPAPSFPPAAWPKGAVHAGHPTGFCAGVRPACPPLLCRRVRPSRLPPTRLATTTTKTIVQTRRRPLSTLRLLRLPTALPLHPTLRTMMGQRRRLTTRPWLPASRRCQRPTRSLMAGPSTVLTPSRRRTRRATPPLTGPPSLYFCCSLVMAGVAGAVAGVRELGAPTSTPSPSAVTGLLWCLRRATMPCCTDE